MRQRESDIKSESEGVRESKREGEGDRERERGREDFFFVVFSLKSLGVLLTPTAITHCQFELRKNFFQAVVVLGALPLARTNLAKIHQVFYFLIFIINWSM